MLVYMINELLTEKKIPMNTILSYLGTCSGDFCAWYNSLDEVQDGWRRSFFQKYLPEPYQPYLRKIFSELGESQILARIAYEIDEDQRTFAASPEARERALDMLVNDLGYLQKYDGKADLMKYILGTVSETFKDKAGVIKQLIGVTSEFREYKEEIETDASILHSYDADVVRRLFDTMIEVDKIFVTANQTHEYRQYSFLSAYQLWWFKRMVSRLDKKSGGIKFTVHDFNNQQGNREHVFITRMFEEVMPTVEVVMGTADLVQLVRKIASALHSVEDNTGVNIPISFIPLPKETNSKRDFHGVWHEDALLRTLVENTKRDKFGMLLKAFIALGRFHNIMESAGVEFPSFYTELSQDKYYIYKFVTLADYLNHSHKVLSMIRENNLPASLKGLFSPTNYEKPVGNQNGELTRFNEFFSLLAQYIKNTLRRPIYIDKESAPVYAYLLKDAYEDMAKGEDPLHYIIPNHPIGPLNDFKYRKFVSLAEEYFPDDVPAGYLTLFYKREERLNKLPLFIRLYEPIYAIYNYIVEMIGSSNGVTNVTGPPPKLLVTDAEFSIVITEHETFLQLSQMQVDNALNKEETLISIAAILMKDKVGAREIIEFLSRAPDNFTNHWEHIQHILIGLYKVSRASRGILFDFDRSERVPPLIPADKAKRYKMQAELKQSSQQMQSRLARIEKQGYHKNETGFLCTENGTYLINYFAGSAYFAHVDGYYINDKLEIRILEEN